MAQVRYFGCCQNLVQQGIGSGRCLRWWMMGGRCTTSAAVSSSVAVAVRS